MDKNPEKRLMKEHQEDEKQLKSDSEDKDSPKEIEKDAKHPQSNFQEKEQALKHRNEDQIYSEASMSNSISTKEDENNRMYNENSDVQKRLPAK